ncbi:GNAT family N-acetyltransferase [bacterium LRH843]|nr:GNAT family N-acetyltransferase [bacterium LRH843]
MKWVLKSFEELSISELYEVIRLRIDVFVVEQECPYHELDGLDQKAFHLMGYKDGELVAYSRLFNSGIAASEASIGRVIVKKNTRGEGTGQALLTEAIRQMEETLGEKTIIISAQSYLERFYQSFQFETVSNVYDMDGLPHIDMIRKK